MLVACNLCQTRQTISDEKWMSPVSCATCGAEFHLTGARPIDPPETNPLVDHRPDHFGSPEQGGWFLKFATSQFAIICVFSVVVALSWWTPTHLTRRTSLTRKPWVRANAQKSPDGSQQIPSNHSEATASQPIASDPTASEPIANEPPLVPRQLGPPVVPRPFVPPLPKILPPSSSQTAELAEQLIDQQQSIHARMKSLMETAPAPAIDSDQDRNSANPTPLARPSAATNNQNSRSSVTRPPQVELPLRPDINRGYWSPPADRSPTEDVARLVPPPLDDVGPADVTDHATPLAESSEAPPAQPDMQTDDPATENSALATRLQSLDATPDQDRVLGILNRNSGHSVDLNEIKRGTAVVNEADEVTAGQRVFVSWHSRWFRASVIETDGNKNKITYIGWSRGFDEWVTFDRIRFVPKET